MSRRRIALAVVGAGGLARALLAALARSGGVDVVVSARRPAAAKAIARGLTRVRAAARLGEALAGAEVILLAVPDRAIAEVAAAMAPLRKSWRGTIVLHPAGAYGAELLAELAWRGASTGVLHPLAALGAGGGGLIAGAAARVEGTPKAIAAARRLARLAGLVPLEAKALASPEGRRAYHAAASLASNDVVALLGAARDLLVRHGVASTRATAALGALAAGAVAQVRASGLQGALTGPVARGDARTVAAQLAALRSEDPPAAEAHRLLSLRLVELACAAGRLTPAQARGLRRRLTRGRKRSPTV